MKSKKILSMVMGIAMMASLAGCGASSSTANKTSAPAGSTGTAGETAKPAEEMQKITMWSNDQHDQAIFDEKIQQFNDTIGKEKGIEVEYTVYGSDYYSTLDVAVSAGEGPDIFKSNKIGNYSEAGYIMPWENEPGLKPLIDRFSAYNAPGYGEFSEKTYSVPIRVTTYGIACNKEIFEKNELKLPETWDEMRESTKVITENGGGQTYGYALAMGYSSYNYFFANLPNAASVGDEYFNHTTGKYDFAVMKGFFDHIQEIKDDGSMFPGFETMDGDTARAQFSAGNIGMIGVMSSDVATFKNQFPCNFEWEMIPYPAKDAENRFKQPVGVSMSYVISSKCEKEGYSDKVAEFLNYLYSDEIFVATNEAQVDISILGEEITKQSETADMDPNWLRFSDMDVFCIKYPNPDSDLVIEGDTFQDLYNKILTGMVPDVEAALTELTDKYNAALDKAVAEGKVKIDDYIDPDISEKMKWVK